jgi:hypothetical protein
MMALGYRFRNPATRLILGPAVAGAAYPKETCMPTGLVDKAAALARDDADLNVRLAAVMALSSFKFHTNTTPALIALLADPYCIIKIRAAQALIDFKDEYHEPIPRQVVGKLIECLNPNNPPDDLWQTAATLGDLGKGAKEALPFLERLKQHSSPQVRTYATEAVLKVQKQLANKRPRTP